MQQGMAAYMPGPATGVAGAPPDVPVGCWVEKGKIVCEDTGDPLAFPQQKTSGKKTRLKYAQVPKRRKKRRKSKRASAKKKPIGQVAGQPPPIPTDCVGITSEDGKWTKWYCGTGASEIIVIAPSD